MQDARGGLCMPCMICWRTGPCPPTAPAHRLRDTAAPLVVFVRPSHTPAVGQRLSAPARVRGIVVIRSPRRRSRFPPGRLPPPFHKPTRGRSRSGLRLPPANNSARTRRIFRTAARAPLCSETVLCMLESVNGLNHGFIFYLQTYLARTAPFRGPVARCAAANSSDIAALNNGSRRASEALFVR